MNMKKTIAAVAAASLAVSAMATVVSAEESATKTLSYNLVNTVKNDKLGAVTLKVTFRDQPLVAGETLIVELPGFNWWADKVTVSGNYKDTITSSTITPIVATGNEWGEGYNAKTAQILKTAWADTNKYVELRIPIEADGQAGYSIKGAVTGNAQAAVPASATTTSANVTVVDTPAADAKAAKTEITAVMTQTTAGTYDGATAVLTGGTDGTTYTLEATVASGSATWAITPAVTGGTATVTVAAGKTVASGDKIEVKYTAPVAAVTETTKKDTDIANVSVTPAMLKALGAEEGTLTFTRAGGEWGSPSVTGTLKDSQLVASADARFEDGDTFTVDYVAGKDAVEDAKMTADITVTVNYTKTDVESIAEFNAHCKPENFTDGEPDYGVWIRTTGGTIARKLGEGPSSAFSTTDDVMQAPFMTNLTDNIDIIKYLSNANVNGTGNSYKNVGAVLNDAIERYNGGVTFKFVTAQQKVKYVIARVVDDEGKRMYVPSVVDDNSGNGYTLNEAESKYNAYTQDKFTGKTKYTWDHDDYEIIGIYKDGGTDKYMQFGDRAYDWYYDPEGTQYTGYEWAGSELFAGALVINEGLTMSLSDTQYFDWTQTSISFDWDAIQAGAITTNSYANYLSSMKLATSNLWFWDSLEVNMAEVEDEDVSTGEGVEGDEDTIDDEEGDEDIDMSDDEEDLATEDDDVEEETQAPVTEAPVETNPKTGNSAVALAVIPVALAAAAVVAKKRS